MALTMATTMIGFMCFMSLPPRRGALELDREVSRETARRYSPSAFELHL
jgi:hypothetical protein